MKLSRRNVIRGAAAAGVCAGAGLQHSISEAFACEPLGSNKRLVFYVSGNGQEPSQWAHDYDFDSPLPVMLAPLEEFRDDLLLVQGIGCSFTPGLHGNYFAPLSCVREPVLTDDDTEYWMRFPGGITFDRFMANELRGTTPLQSLVLAHPHRYSYDPASAPPSLPCSSADGPDTPVAPEWDPVAVYDAYFAGAGDDPAQ